MGRKRASFFLARIQLKYIDKTVELWYQDESRFGQQGYLSYRWQRKGKRTECIKQQEFENTYYYGAINPSNGDKFSLLFPYCNSETTSYFLNKLSDKIGSDKIAVLIMDQAGWHKSKTLKIPNNIKVFHLPPYSPQLNPIERVWQYLKKKYLSNRVFNSYEHILDSGCEAWNFLSNNIIKSISGNYLSVSSH